MAFNPPLMVLFRDLLERWALNVCRVPANLGHLTGRIVEWRLHRPGKAICGSPVELSTLDVDAVLANGHAQVLHSEDSPALATALSATTVTCARRTQVGILCFGPTVFGASARSSGALWACPSRESTHGVIACSVGGSNARVLVCIRSYVRDELLSRKREEAGKMWRGLRRRGKPGPGEIIICDCVWDLAEVSPDSARAGTQRTIGA